VGAPAGVRGVQRRPPGPGFPRSGQDGDRDRHRGLAEAGDQGQGARHFWQTYLDQFDEIRSEFSHLIEADGQAALVWTSKGALKGGRPIAYRGVSIVEHDGGKVHRFETVYDSAAFLREKAPTAGA
jgi:ketosteroid isomerase-like protein